ncbi:hypothetical protein Cgig2_029064 [Carnegiea gigantea]|uniref:SKP1-like protein n=1 Tax=Carnegiea gigantea TaxID=171969 RepID=A0A9Q1KA96_9CARY|nr:hypothetical protein Cgig2_029064 [Carnegiea gigantea]
MASEQEEKKAVMLKSNDGQTFEVAKEAASMSETISQMIEDDVGDEIPLPLVSGEILAKIIEYCNKHTETETEIESDTKGKEKADGDEAPKITSNSKKNPLKEWDKEFINMDIGQLFELAKAANYLNIKDLLDLTCQAIADHIQDKSVEEVRKIFNIENDFTPEEEEAILKKKKKIVLRSSDGNDFEVDEDVAMESNTIKNMLEDLSDSEAIPLPSITGKILSKVIEYCKKHVETPKSDTRFAADDLKDWDAAFTKDLIHDQETLFDLMLASNYLDIKGLLDLTCQYVADATKGKKPEEIRATFHIVNDYTPEEEDEIRRELSWAFE